MNNSYINLDEIDSYEKIFNKLKHKKIRGRYAGGIFMKKCVLHVVKNDILIYWDSFTIYYSSYLDYTRNLKRYDVNSSIKYNDKFYIINGRNDTPRELNLVVENFDNIFDL